MSAVAPRVAVTMSDPTSPATHAPTDPAAMLPTYQPTAPGTGDQPGPAPAVPGVRGRLHRLLPDPGPGRRLAAATFVSTMGNGLFYTASALFFTRSVGLTAGQVGLGLTVAGALGLGAAVPMGHLADRLGPRGLLVALLLLEGAFTLGYVLVGDFPGFLVVACLVTLVDRGANAVRSALIAGVLPPQGRVRTRAYLRSVTNLGISLGTVGAGVALHFDTRAAYVSLLVLDAASFVVAALLVAGLPRVQPHPGAAAASRTAALRDRPFLAVTGLNALLAVHYGLLELAVPLWIAERTSAPRWSVAAVMLVNTVMCVLFQVRASRGTEQIDAAARASRRGGLLLAVSCALFAGAAGRSPLVAVAVLLVAALVQVLGELAQAAGSWGLGFGLAPDHLQGQYQGVFSTGFSISSMLAPVVVVTLAVGWGTPGWLLIGACFVAAGVAMVPVARWAQSTRPLPAGAARVTA